MNFNEEFSAAMREVDHVPGGMGEQFQFGGRLYFGVWSGGDMQTTMLTGGFNGRSSNYIRASRSQFPDEPAQRTGDIVRMSDKTIWTVKQITPDDNAHYVFEVLRQITQ